MGVIMYNGIQYTGAGGGGGDVEDVYVNGTSVLDSNKIAQVKSYMELTESQYNALPASKLSDDVLYCISDIDYEDKNYFNPIIYSTTEREVGVWTDGKPLYQKTVIVTSIVSGTNTINHNISNIDRIVNTSGTFFATNNTSPIPNEISDNTWFLNMYDFGSTTFSLSIGSKWVQYFDHIQVTMQYTKTTDVAGSGKYNTLGVPTVHYDDNEQVIGTWFGKPLYQKIITITLGATDSNWHNVNHNITDIEDFVKVEGLAINSTTKSSYPIPGYRPSNNVGFCLNATLTTIDYINNWLSTDILRVILQYTKTTD